MGEFYLHHEKPITNNREDGFIINFKLIHGDDERTSTEQIVIPLKFRAVISKFVKDIEGREPTAMKDYNSFYDDADGYISNFCIAYENIADIQKDESEELENCLSDLDIDLDELIEQYKDEKNVYFSTLNGMVYTQADYELAKYVKYSPDTDITDDDKYAGCSGIVVMEVQDNKYYAVYTTT